jgi:hypothetical protein
MSPAFAGLSFFANFFLLVAVLSLRAAATIFTRPYFYLDALLPHRKQIAERVKGTHLALPPHFFAQQRGRELP